MEAELVDEGDFDGNVHVMPIDGRPHVERSDCWCRPELIAVFGKWMMATLMLIHHEESERRH